MKNKLFLSPLALLFSFLAGCSAINQGNLALESSAKTYVASVTKANYEYWHNNQKEASSFEELGMGIGSGFATKGYHPFEMLQTGQGYIVTIARAKKPTLRTYVGIAFTSRNPSYSGMPSRLHCRSREKGDSAPKITADTFREMQDIDCPLGYVDYN